MNGAQVKPNISYASVVSGNYKSLSWYSASSLSDFRSPGKQYFSLPYEVMKYIIKNPKSPEGLLKFNQTCKYFYLKQKILVVAGKFTWQGMGGFFKFENVSHFKNNGFLKNVKTPHLWLHDDIVIDKDYFLDLKKVYRSTIKFLIILRAKITLKELELLVAEKTVESFTLSIVGKIIDSNNGKEVLIDKILELLPNVRDFRYFNENEKYSKETLKKMVDIKFNKKLTKFMLYLNEVSADFDANLLFEFILKNAGEFCKIHLVPGEENGETTLSKLKAAKEKMCSLEKWKEQKFLVFYEFEFE